MQQVLYTSKRNDFLYNITVDALNVLLKTRYSINFENSEILKEFDNKGFVLMPKHQSLIDIILEGIILKKVIKRPANYIMKQSLPNFFEYFGGIKLTRQKDIMKIKDRKQRKEGLMRAQKGKDYIYSVVQSLLQQEEIVVIHPEGERNYKKVSKPKKSILKKLIAMQHKMMEPITFVPLDINYQNKFAPFSNITLKVGKPLQTDDISTLEKHLINEIELFESDI